MEEAVIVSAARTAVGKAPNGALRTVRPDDMAAIVIREALKRAQGLDPAEVDDVLLGCAMPEAEQGMNVARIASLRAGVPVQASAATINRFCSSGLQSIAFAAEHIMCGFANVIVAGGTETMSMIPMGGHKVSPNPWLVETYADTYLSTGLVAENHARLSKVTRQEQDAFALESHRRAVAAIDAGRFKDEIVGVPVRLVEPVPAGAAVAASEVVGASALAGVGAMTVAGAMASGSPGSLASREFVFDVDEGPRRDTSMEALGKLKPAFLNNGTVTAGNSSQMSDGAAAVVVMSASRAKALGLKPLARFVTFATAGVEPELFGIGPVPAMRKALKLAGLALEQIDLVELNEAFASQVLAILKEMPIDPARLNVNGGAIALGHPLGCTGAKLTTQILYEMRRRQARYGMVTMCVGGGMGAAGIFERV